MSGPPPGRYALSRSDPDRVTEMRVIDNAWPVAYVT